MRIFNKLKNERQNRNAEKNNNQAVASPPQDTAASYKNDAPSAHRVKRGSSVVVTVGDYLSNMIAPKSKSKPKPNPAPKPVAVNQQEQKPPLKSSIILEPTRAPQPDSTSGAKFEDLYEFKRVLGHGAFSTVREAKHKIDRKKTYAIKCQERSKMTNDDEEALVDEVSILQEFDHSAIVCLYDFFKERKMYYLVMEQMQGGELFDRIVAKAYYNEKEARDVCKIVLEAIEYCHINNVAHRDLKPENLLLVHKTDDQIVKIGDFGFAKRVKKPNSLVTQCGTPGYVAPEILEGRKYDTRADMWSVGVILYILLGGYPPFNENNQRMLFRKIRKGQYEFHEEYWGSVSQEAKNLISSLLNIDPNARLSASQALKDKWITSDAKLLEDKDLGTNLEELRKWNAVRKVKAAVKSIIAANKMTSLGSNLRNDLDNAEE